jgi:hypothetical protein
MVSAVQIVVIKLCFTLGLVLCSILINAQSKYFIIREGVEKYDIKKYTLDTKSLYEVTGTVEIYNLFPAQTISRQNENSVKEEQDLILFSVLPDFQSDQNWIEIDLKTIAADTITFSQLSRLKERSLAMRFDMGYQDQTKYFNNYKIVVLKEGKYYAAKNCLLQFFAIRNRPSLFPSFYGTINILQDKVSIKDFKTVFDKQIRGRTFPLDSWLTSYSDFDRLRDRREFFSKSFNYKEYEAFQFWTYTDWHEDKAFYEVDRGIDRFVYIPGKGVIGGSFDFYYYYHRKVIGLNLVQFGKSMYEEKVMLAEDL